MSVKVSWTLLSDIVIVAPIKARRQSSFMDDTDGLIVSQGFLSVSDIIVISTGPR